MEWISVDDRLPPSTGTVIVCAIDLVFPGSYDGYSDTWHTDDGWRLPNVTHWMPMPEPPEEEQDAES